MVDYGVYTIGWICAIRAELVAAQELLDEELMEPIPAPKNDNNTYTLGKIGPHHVVIAGLPRGQYGVTSAANAARDMVRTFPNVRIGFMVGIGGGVPTQYDIRLGDIVVGSPSYRSGGLIQYDHGKAIQSRGIALMGALNQPPISVLTAITKLSAFHDRKGHDLNHTVDDALAKNPRLVKLGYQRPPEDTDKLYEADFIHLSQGRKCSEVCPTSYLKQREPRSEDQDNPKIHYGLIASGSQLMEDAVARDELAKKEHVLCFEMEAAGLANHFPCVVIRGICDYSDSHRGREWQGYAALMAAAYAKQLLLQIPPENIKAEEKMKDILQQIDKRLEPLVETKVIVEALKVKGKREDELRIIDWLNAVDYSPEQHSFLQPEQRQPGTGQQFIQSEDFQTWISTKNSFLFCSGMPGAGKTITAAITIEHLVSAFGDDPTVGVAYVYCSYQKRDQQRPQDLFTSLLAQLSRAQSPLPKAMPDLYKKNHNGRERPTFEDILTTLCKVISSFSTTFIIIDALDEHDAWDTFLSDVLVLREQTTANIFLTSRPKPSLPDKLQGCLIHDIQADEQDVGLYIDQRMKQMMVLSIHNAELSDERKEEFRKLIREKLSKAVNGVFLLARIYLDNLKEETNLKGISTFLEHVPTDLRGYDDAYKKTIRRIRNQGPKHRALAQKALAWLTFARRPLSGEEFRHALSVEDGMSDLKDEDLESTNVILHVCMDLVKMEEGTRTVSLLHFTTMEYLKANPNCLLSLESPDNPKFINNPSDSEIEKRIAREYYEMKLATVCLTYLLFEKFGSWQSGVTAGELGMPLRVAYPLYPYAARSWAHHSRRGAPCSKILEFLRSQPHASASSECLTAFRPTPLSLFAWFNDYLDRVNGLHLTAYFGLETETAFLLRSGMEPDVRDGQGITPLSFASAGGHQRVVDILLQAQGIDPNSKCRVSMTPLHCAAHEGHESIVKSLLEISRVDPEARDSFGMTPLHLAARAGHELTVKHMIATKRVDPESSDDRDMTPLSYAARAGHEPIVKLLLAINEIHPDLKDIPNIMIVDGHVDTNSKNDKGQTPLFHAAINGHESIVKLFLARVDTKPNAQDFEGRTVLSHAVDGHDVIFELLLASQDINPDLEDYNGRTPLSHAAESSSSNGNFQLLLADDRVGADTKDASGRTPLSYAAGQKNVFKVKLLLENPEVNPNTTDTLGRTPFSYAAEKGEPELCEVFLANTSVEVDSQDTSGRTPLSYLVERTRALLNQIDRESNRYSHYGRSAEFHLSIDKDELDRVRNLMRELVVEKGVNIFVKDEKGHTPADMMPELLRLGRTESPQQQGKKRKMCD